jgi:hypothetical protein
MLSADTFLTLESASLVTSMLNADMLPPRKSCPQQALLMSGFDTRRVVDERGASL